MDDNCRRWLLYTRQSGASIFLCAGALPSNEEIAWSRSFLRAVRARVEGEPRANRVEPDRSPAGRAAPAFVPAGAADDASF